MIRVLYEDDYVLAVDKPAGVLVEAIVGKNEDSLVDLIEKGHLRVFVVHRLDRDTSGIVVFAKTPKSQVALQKLFQDHSVQKTYRAIVEGVIPENTFTIDAPLRREKKSFKRSVGSAGRGKEVSALTEGKVVERYEDKTLILLMPQTGRTHQLRVHMAFFEHPILGDVIYGTAKNKEKLFLHAEKLEFELRGKKYSINSVADF